MEYSLSKLAFIEAETQEKLLKSGIRNTNDLLSFTLALEKRERLSREIGIPEFILHKWANKCSLMQIKGIGLKNSEILDEIGIDTIDKLEKSVPQLVYRDMTRFFKDTDYRRSASVDQISSWISQAKKIHIEKDNYFAIYTRRALAILFSIFSILYTFWIPQHTYSVLFSFLSLFLIIYEINLPSLITFTQNRRERLITSFLGSFSFLVSRILLEVMIVGISFTFNLTSPTFTPSAFSFLLYFYSPIFALFLLFVMLTMTRYLSSRKFKEFSFSQGVDYKRGIQTLAVLMVFMAFGGDMLVSPLILVASSILFVSKNSTKLFSLGRLVRDFWFNICDTRRFPLAEQYSTLMTTAIALFSINILFFNFSFRSILILFLNLFTAFLAYYWIYKRKISLKTLMLCALPMVFSVVIGIISPSSWPFIRVLEVDLVEKIGISIVRDLSLNEYMYEHSLEMFEKYGLPGISHLLKFFATISFTLILYQIAHSVIAGWQELKLNTYVQDKKASGLAGILDSYFFAQGSILVIVALFFIIITFSPTPETWSQFDIEPPITSVVKILVLLVALLVILAVFINEIEIKQNISMSGQVFELRKLYKKSTPATQSILLLTAIYVILVVGFSLLIARMENTMYNLTMLAPEEFGYSLSNPYEKDFSIVFIFNGCVSMIWGCFFIIARSELIEKGGYSKSDVSFTDLLRLSRLLEVIKKDRMIFFSLLYGLIGSFFLILFLMS